MNVKNTENRKKRLKYKSKKGFGQRVGARQEKQHPHAVQLSEAVSAADPGQRGRGEVPRPVLPVGQAAEARQGGRGRDYF